MDLRCLAVALVVLSAGSGAVFADPAAAGVELGAVSAPDLFEPALPFLDLQPEGAHVLERGAWRADVTVTVANTFAYSRVVLPILNARDQREPVDFGLLRSLEDIDGSEGVFYLDGEVWQTLVSLRRGFPAGVELRLDIPWRDVQPGLLDPLVEPFHKALGFDRVGREGVPRNVHQLYVRSNGRLEEARDQDPGPGLGDIVLSAKGRLPDLGRWSLAIEGVAKLPTGDEASLYGSGSVDLGLQLHTGRALPRSWGEIHLTLGARRLGRSEVWQTPEQTLWSLFAGWVRPFGERRVWESFLQGTLTEVPFESLLLEELAREAWLFDLGLRRRFSDGRFLWFALTENQFTYQSSADFGLSVGVGWAGGGER